MTRAVNITAVILYMQKRHNEMGAVKMGSQDSDVFSEKD